MSAIRVVRSIGEDDGVEYGVEDERRVEERGTEREMVRSPIAGLEFQEVFTAVMKDNSEISS